VQGWYASIEQPTRSWGVDPSGVLAKVAALITLISEYV
jgi:hypothetical protein